MTAIAPGLHRRRPRLAAPAALLLLAAALAGRAVPALPITDSPPNQDPPCLSGLHLIRYTAAPAVVNLGSTTTLQWKVLVPAGCGELNLDIGGRFVSPQGSLIVRPPASTAYRMRATYLNRLRDLGSVGVSVLLPSTVPIHAGDPADLLVQALGTPNTTIVLDNAVNLDLSYRDSIPVAAGITLRGGRTGREPGPRLFTTTRPGSLLNVQGDDVRITGVRIEGPEQGIGDGDDDVPKGIAIESANDVEIDRCEILGWPGVGVEVDDPAGRIDYALNPETVRIHDNFIHHNQHTAKFGYGVAIGPGAYALIDQNVFDWNRHSIASDGHSGTGYRAYRNLVLEHGGYNRWWGWPIGWQHTHAFDMHGTDSCGVGSVFSDAVYNCGTGGHDVDIRYNAFLYTDGADFVLRGTPELSPYGAFVVNNVFANGSIDDAVQETESGLYVADNQVGFNGMKALGRGDFDGDGIADSFLATGETWWYSSGGTGPWVYLNASTLRLSDVTLGDVDGDGRCDVSSGGLVSSGGTGPLKPLVHVRLGGLQAKG